MAKIEIEVRLSDEDRALLNEVKTAAKVVVGGKPGKGKQTPTADDDFEETAGEEEAGEEEAGEEEAGEEETGPTRDDVQAALRAYAGVSSKADALALMKKTGGAEALSKLKEAKFAAVITAANAATKKAKAKK